MGDFDNSDQELDDEDIDEDSDEVAKYRLAECYRAPLHNKSVDLSRPTGWPHAFKKVQRPVKYLMAV